MTCEQWFSKFGLRSKIKLDACFYCKKMPISSRTKVWSFGWFGNQCVKFNGNLNIATINPGLPLLVVKSTVLLVCSGMHILRDRLIG